MAHLLAGRAGPLAVAALTAVAGCSGIPVDPDGTLDRARGGALRVGMSAHEPWTVVEGGERSGVEVRLVEGFAEAVDAEIEWHDGGEEALMERLHAGELDVVVGGLTERSPWSSHAGLTRPYVVVTSPSGGDEPHVMAVRLGENALQVALERHLQRHESEVAAELDGEPP